MDNYLKMFFHSYFGSHSLSFLARTVSIFYLFPWRFSSFFFFGFFVFLTLKRKVPIGRYRLSRRCSQMSIVPLVFRNWWDDFDRPVSRLLDQHFGIGLHRDDLISNLSGLGIDRTPIRSILGNRYYRPWGNVTTRQNSSGTSTIQLENDNFQVGIRRYWFYDIERQRDRTLRYAIRSKMNLRISFLLFADLYDFELGPNMSLREEDKVFGL